eukprot:Pgem_evm1s6272
MCDLGQMFRLASQHFSQTINATECQQGMLTNTDGSMQSGCIYSGENSTNSTTASYCCRIGQVNGTVTFTSKKATYADSQTLCTTTASDPRR